MIGLACFGDPHKCALVKAKTWLFVLLGITGTLICMTMICLQYSRDDIFHIGLRCNSTLAFRFNGSGVPFRGNMEYGGCTQQVDTEAKR